jgi:hypothetical protein
MAVGKRVYAATCYIRTPAGIELAPGDEVSEGDAVLKDNESYFEQVRVEAVEAKTTTPTKK